MEDTEAKASIKILEKLLKADEPKLPARIKHPEKLFIHTKQTRSRSAGSAGSTPKKKKKN